MPFNQKKGFSSSKSDRRAAQSSVRLTAWHKGQTMDDTSVNNELNIEPVISNSDCTINLDSKESLQSGRRIVELGHLVDQLRSCVDCGQQLNLVNIKGEKLYGFGSVLSVECQCGLLNRIETSKRHCTTGSRGPPIFYVNLKAALAESAFRNMEELTEVSSNKMFGGLQKVFSHKSTECNCTMTFGVFIPSQAEDKQVPVLYWLSGLTCTEQNFISKAGAQRVAADKGLIIVAPDTSPRGLDIEGEHESYDFGSGAGFYVDATEDKWKTNYRMYSYITKELPDLINRSFNTCSDKMSIFGHSMGGHGALICAMKNPGKYKSVSAFAPICNPIKAPWGIKAFTGYLGGNESKWQEYDATELAKKYDGPPLTIFIDQGKSDNFLGDNQLLPDNLVAACTLNKVPVILRKQEGYDHSYYFIATFMADHINHHAEFLCQ